MSLAYQLWKIGGVLGKDDIKNVLKVDVELENGHEPNHINIDFTIKDNYIISIQLRENAISKEKMFFSKKIGGSGDGMYYLYPNLNISNETLEKKIIQLANTVEKSVLKFSCREHKVLASIVYEKLKHIKIYKNLISLEAAIDNGKLELEQLNKENGKEKEMYRIAKEIEKKAKELQSTTNDFDKWDNKIFSCIKEISRKKKSYYWFWLSINGKTFNELMPEIWDNWYEDPTIKNDDVTIGYDAFTNKKIGVGYRPEIKVFSYDNYHQSLMHRINKNLPLSSESARNIKFAWIYLSNKLVFYYKRLEYIIIPTLFSENDQVFKEILNRFERANKKTNVKRSILESLKKNEDRLQKEIEKLKKKERKYDNEENERNKNAEEISKLDKGIVSQWDEELDEIDDLKDHIKIDYLFTKIDRKNGSFVIKGSIEDIIPSHISRVVDLMRKYKISDLISLKQLNGEKTLLQDFFSRNELYFAVNKSSKNNNNSILKERLYLAKLLLTDQKIKMDDLLRRFEKNREYNYKNKRRSTKDGIKVWIEFPNTFIKDEKIILNFLKELDKIKEA